MKKYLKPFAIILILVAQRNAVAVTIDYTYDALGRLTEVVYADAKMLNYRYDAAGNILQVNTFSNTQCGDANVLISQKTYSSTANETCTATAQLIAGPDVLLSSGATVTYHAPQIILRNGFRATLGSKLVVNTHAISVKSMLAQTVTHGIEERLTSLDTPIFTSFNTGQFTFDSILAGIMQNPPIINGITLNPEQLSGLDFDSNRVYLVFATDQSFVIEDQNNLSDIYLFNTESSGVVLLSYTQDHISGQGDSRFPVIDGAGRYIAFQSSANNLLSNDNNPGSDIFVYDNDKHVLLILSEQQEYQTITEFSHPAIDGAGLNLLYEGVVEKENSYIQLYDHLAQETGIITSNASNYFPAISRNGRYLAYLEVDKNEGVCFVHWRDNQSDMEINTDCAGIDINMNGLLRFSDNNDTLVWRDSLWSVREFNINNPHIWERF